MLWDAVRKKRENAGKIPTLRDHPFPPPLWDFFPKNTVFSEGNFFKKNKTFLAPQDYFGMLLKLGKNMKKQDLV